MRSETLEEGMMHEIEYTKQRGKPHKSHRKSPSSGHKNNTHEVTYDRQVSKYDPSAVQTRDQEWTTTKRIVNHKTRQVETRVQRQLVMEDGKVIADSGPQVITRVREDCRNEEQQNDNKPPPVAPPEGWVPIENEVGKVMGEKKEVSVVSREIREENMQYHDERIKELTGKDVHRRALTAPNELITINDKKHPDYYYRQHKGSGSDDSDNEVNNKGKLERTNNGKLFSLPPRGKMIHYSAKGKKFQDTDEIHTVSKLAADGSITKEVKHTKHHEEFSDDEEPDRDGTAPREPVATKQTRQHVEYLHDYTSSSDNSDASDTENRHRRREHRVSSSNGHTTTKDKQHKSREHKSHKSHKSKSKPFTLEPTLERQSTMSDDYKHDSSKNWIKHTFERTDRDSPEEREDNRVSKSHKSQMRSESPVGFVPVPDEYKINREKLEKSKLASHHHSTEQRQHRHHHRSGSNLKDKSPSPERSYSLAKSHRSHASHKGSHRSLAPKEDASVQATLTDEERSIASEHSHKKSTKSLQRQSTSKSQRSYYFGEPEPMSHDDSMDERRYRTAPSPSSKHHSGSSSHRSSPSKSPRNEAHSEIGLRPVSRQSGTRSPAQSDIYSVSRNRPSSKNSQVKKTTSTMSATLDHKRSKSPSDKQKVNDGKPVVLFSSTMGRAEYNQNNTCEPITRESTVTIGRADDADDKLSRDVDRLKKKLENIVAQHVAAVLNQDETLPGTSIIEVRNYRSRQRAPSPGGERLTADSLLQRLNNSSKSMWNLSDTQYVNTVSIDPIVTTATNTGTVAAEAAAPDRMEEAAHLDPNDADLSLYSVSTNKTYDISEPIVNRDNARLDINKQLMTELHRDADSVPAPPVITLPLNNMNNDCDKNKDYSLSRSTPDARNGDFEYRFTEIKSSPSERPIINSMVNNYATTINDNNSHHDTSYMDHAESMKNENISDNGPNVAKGGQSYFLDLETNQVKKDLPYKPMTPRFDRDARYASSPALYRKPREYFPVHHVASVQQRNTRRPLEAILASINGSASRIKREAAARNNVRASSIGDMWSVGQNPKRSRSRADMSPTAWPASKSTKYSIYGGMKKSEFDMPARVPRLSYSRSIGPEKATTSPTSRPSRFLKLK